MKKKRLEPGHVVDPHMDWEMVRRRPTVIGTETLDTLTAQEREIFRLNRSQNPPFEELPTMPDRRVAVHTPRWIVVGAVAGYAAYIVMLVFLICVNLGVIK